MPSHQYEVYTSLTEYYILHIYECLIGIVYEHKWTA